VGSAWALPYAAAVAQLEPSTRRVGPGRPRKVDRTSGVVNDARAEIVAAASRLFARRGIAATTMAEIAEAAGLQASSLYYWFRSKQQILEVIVKDVNRAPLAFAEDVANQSGSPAVRLYRLIRFDVETLCAFPFDINEVHRLASEPDAEFIRYWDDRLRLVEAVESLVREGVQRGELRDLDPHLVALTLLANDEATQNWMRGDDPADPTAVAGFVADLALRGLLTDPTALDEIRAASAS
jgi:TetR/AcrR family transcriptional regulator